MPVEIDIFTVGETDGACGDAIVLRFGDDINNPAQTNIVVIDGGYQKDGQAVVDWIKGHYKSQTVDLLISTHPDCDHSTGLITIVNQLTVRELWMHLPWCYGNLISWYHEGKVRPGHCRQHLQESLDTALNLYYAAKAKGITPIQPFAGQAYGTGLIALGPTEPFYGTLIPKFSGFPAMKASLSGLKSFAEFLAESHDEWEKDNLKNDPTQPSAENHSSVVLWFSWDGYKVLFTGDAGVEGLTNALQYAAAAGINVQDANLVQVPHHGSRHNISTPVLDMMLGPTVPKGTVKRHAFVSAPSKGGPKHPSKRTMNAFARRGAPVTWNQTGGILHFNKNGIPRNWTSVSSQPFHSSVEAVD